MSPRQPIEVQRGLVASLDRHDEGAGSVPTPRAERQSGRDRERQLLCPACGRATTHRFLYAKNGCDILPCRSAASAAPRRRLRPASLLHRRLFFRRPCRRLCRLRRRRAGAAARVRPHRRFIRRFRAGGRLLELGCAYGFFLDEAKRPASTSTASSSPPRRPRGARARPRRDDRHRRREPLWQLGSVDVIVLLDVIEHLEDPHDTLALCVRHLAPGGIIVRHHRRFRLAARPPRRPLLAADDAAAASVVLHPRQHGTPGRLARLAPRAFRPSVEDRAAVADRLPAPPHARPETQGAGRRAASACRSICSTPCGSSCRSRRGPQP